MNRDERPHTPSRRIAIACAAVAFLLATGPAYAMSTASETDPGVAGWVGRYCTPLGCRAPLESAAGNAAGFGAAALAAVWLARRRRA